MLKSWMIGCSLSVLVVLPALAQEGDPAEGEKVFKRCQACHVINAPTNRVGPSLQGVYGRKAGAVEGFKYSDAMKKAGEEGLVWNDENLHKYLENPKGEVKGNKMAFAGLKKPEERDNVIAYIKQAGGSGG